MKLTLNEEKSRKINAYEEAFEFLGFSFRYLKSILKKNGPKYWNIEPSKEALKKIRKNIKEYLKKNANKSAGDIAKGLNTKMKGWINYFSIQKVTYPAKAKSAIRNYLNMKIYRYYKRKSQRRCKLYNQEEFRILNKKSGLIDPVKYVPN